MKFTIKVSEIGGSMKPWEESYDKDVSDPKTWAEETLARFNSTLRPGEKPRELLDVIVDGSKPDRQVQPDSPHAWGKSNLVTVSSRGRVYDEYKCKNCGVTAKRLGLAANYKIDSKFKAKVYQRCDTALAHKLKVEQVSSAPTRTKVGEWTVDSLALEAYLNHVEKRFRMEDDRDIEVKENERTALHNKVAASVLPKLDEDAQSDEDIIMPMEFDDALKAIVEKKCGLYDPTMMGQ